MLTIFHLQGWKNTTNSTSLHEALRTLVRSHHYQNWSLESGTFSVYLKLNIIVLIFIFKITQLIYALAIELIELTRN